MRTIPGARIMEQEQAGIGTRAAAITFPLAGMRSSDVVRRLVGKVIAVLNGYFYALRCLVELGIEDMGDGIIWGGLVHCNSVEDVGRLLEGVGSLLRT